MFKQEKKIQGKAPRLAGCFFIVPGGVSFLSLEELGGALACLRTYQKHLKNEAA